MMATAAAQHLASERDHKHHSHTSPFRPLSMRPLCLLCLTCVVSCIYPLPCSLYLAPSSIQEAGVGVYTNREFAIGDRIGTPSIAIPWIDQEASKNTSDQVNSTKTSFLPKFLHDAPGIGGFGEATNVSLFLPGLPSLVQFHTTLDNVRISGLTLDPTLYREQSPMAGSFTAYHSVTLVAKTRLRKGQELFLFPTNPHQQQSMPDQGMAQEAENLVNEIAQFASTATLTSAQWTDLLFRIKEDVMVNSKVADLLPRSEFELNKASTRGLAMSKLIERTQGWIQHEGFCLGAIRQGRSDETQRGAYATQFLEEGSVVMTSPVIPVHLLSFQMDRRSNHSNNTQQLLLNYCLGHRHSSTLFCPTSSAAMMNHDAASPNVKLQWKEPCTILQGSLEELWNATTPTTILIEYIALRDIQDGEELILSYGKEWEETYQRHLNRGVSEVPGAAPPLPELSAELYNDFAKESLVLSQHVPSHLRSQCLIHPELPILKDRNQWEDFFSNSMAELQNWPIEQRRLYQHDNFSGWYPCELVSMHPDGKTFDAHVFPQGLFQTEVARRFRGIPRERIRFVNAPYHSDQHLKWAFRHYISIPDAIFPLRWRDDYKPSSHWQLGVVDDRTAHNAYTRKGLQEEYESAVRQAKCGVYMAESNIPNAGFGTFAAVDVPARNIMVGSSLPEVPVNKEKDKAWPGTEYVWQSYGLPENQECPAVLRGLFGAIANSHTGITNMKSPSRYDPVYDPIVDRRHDPGAGAFTPYFDNHFVSAYPVKAGEELFVTYGEHWFRNRADYAEVPLKEHFRRANEALSSIWSMLTLEGASLFHADLVRMANEEKLNPEFHQHHSVLLPTCHMDSFEDSNELPDSMEVIVLRQKSSRPSNMPSSIAARMNIPQTFESYEGIRFEDETFDLPSFYGLDGASFRPCRILKAEESAGSLDVLIFLQKEGRRMLIKRSQMPHEMLHFRISPAYDSLKGLVGLLREHVMKDFDGSGSTSDSFRRTRTALLGIESYDDIQTVMERNGTAMATTQPRSNEWLEENGFCLDHIYVKRSSIPKAGNGAFSRRFLPKGSLVIGSPLLAGFRDNFLFNMTLSASGNVSPEHKSLIYNYHFGHKDSSVLFFPISPVIAINHNSISMSPDHGKEANVKIRFSTKDKKSRYLVHRPLEDIRKERYSSMVLELIATRDIEPDEEIFIDYGRDWEDAWKVHVSQWQDPCMDSSRENEPCFKSSGIIAGMNRDKFNESYHAWSDDHLAYCTFHQDDKVDPADIHTKLLTHDNQFTNFASAVETEHYESYQGISPEHEGFQISSFRKSSGERVYPCQIVNSSKASNTFEVLMFHDAKKESENSILKVEHIHNFSADWLAFRPKPFHGDTTMPYGFRHEIAIPDESFPELWKD